MAYINQEDLLAATNGGLNVILWKYPGAQAAVDKPNAKFKVRDNEKTASASLKRLPDGTYVVTDFGGDQKPRNAIQIVMHEDGVDFKTAITIIADRFNLTPDVKKTTLAKADFVKRDKTEEEEEGKYYFDFKDSFSDIDLKEIFADKVIENVLAGTNGNKDPEENLLENILAEAKIESGDALPADTYAVLRIVLKKYNCFSLKSFTQIKNSQALVTSSNDQYPIFLFDFGDKWKKIYQPKNAEKQYRFRYVGERPKDFIFGLQQCIQAYNKLQEVDESLDGNKKVSKEDEDEDEGKQEGTGKVKKLPEIILCSGDRDSLNVAALGYHVVWLNSESAKLSSKQYAQIKRICESFYNLPDIDATGLRQAHELGMTYLDMKLIMLPAELSEKRDFRGNACKDVRDFLRFYKRQAFDDLVKVALPYRFWDRTKRYDRKGLFTHYGYDISNTKVYNFLAKNGFAQLKTQNDQQDIYVKVTGSVVKEVKDKEIRKYVNDFLEHRKMDTDLRDVFYRSKQITGTSFENLPFRTIDFKDFDKDFQFMFFKNKVWKVTKDKVEEFRNGEVDKHVWEQEVIPHRVELLDDFFKINYDKENEDYSIEIKNKDCLLFRFLINSSKMFWKIEEQGIEESDASGKKTMRNKLTPEEIKEQDLHLINRIYTLGYLLHRYKDPSRPWGPWALENKVTEESVSDGGSGKSIFMKVPRFFMKSLTIGARDQHVTENKHLMENVNEHTDFVLIDDCHEYLNFAYFYPMITGEWNINPKNTRSFELSYKDSPKVAFTSNYYPRNVDPSTERRLLYTVFSDYYHHGPSDEHPEPRTPKDEFGKNLFDDFTEPEWNMAINLAAQCLKAYLNFEKINPPMNNVTKRKLMSEMGDVFKNWADVYFSDDSGHLDFELERDIVQEECIKKNNLRNWSAQKFKKALAAWCKLKGYILNPKDMRNADGRIIKRKEGRTYEVLYIQKSIAVKTEEAAPAVPQPAAPPVADDNVDELPF